MGPLSTNSSASTTRGTSIYPCPFADVAFQAPQKRSSWNWQQLLLVLITWIGARKELAPDGFAAIVTIVTLP